MLRSSIQITRVTINLTKTSTNSILSDVFAACAKQRKQETQKHRAFLSKRRNNLAAQALLHITMRKKTASDKITARAPTASNFDPDKQRDRDEASEKNASRKHNSHRGLLGWCLLAQLPAPRSLVTDRRAA